MKDFFQKIKDKLFPNPDFDLEDDELEGSENDGQVNGEEEEIEEQEAEVDLGGAEIASGKKNKMAVIAASSFLIAIVLYFLFFSGSDEPKEKLETVAPVIAPREVAKSEDGKSPFELEVAEKVESDNEISFLEKPKAPEVPKLPELTQEVTDDGLILPNDLFVDDDEKKGKDSGSREDGKGGGGDNKDGDVGDYRLRGNDKGSDKGEGNDKSSGDDKGSDNFKKDDGDKKKAKDEMPALDLGGKKSQGGAPVAASDPRYAPIIVLQGGVGPAQGVGYDNNLKVLNADPINQLEKSAVTVKTSFIEDRTNVVAQGKLINAVLETAINTEAQGTVRGVISRDVYGEAGSKVLIPRGSRLYGAYSTQTARGQSRVQINWTRLIRPDGVSLNISSFASDQFGRAGIEGVVDNKYSAVVVNSVLTSLLAVAGAAFADSMIDDNQRNQTTTVDPNNGTATVTSTATTQAVTDLTRNVTDAASRYANEYFDSRPTITVPQGTRITVLVNADIKMPQMHR